jgi:glycosyltransferase involved in cell wall biosynthesis
MSRPGISVVIPAYNEAQAIRQTLDALLQTLKRIDRPQEVIVVDDGSTDETAALAKTAGVKVIRHPANSGYGRSLLSGIKSASYDIVAIVDADGTYPVEQLPEFLDTLDQGFDMVVGARSGQYYYASLGKRCLRFIFRILAEYTCGRSIPDINSGFRVFYRQPLLMWQASVSTGFSFTTTITLLYILNNLLVTYRPINYNKRVGKSKVRLLQDGLRSLQIILTAIAQFNPIKLYLLLLLGNLLGTLALIAFQLGMPAVIGPAVGWWLIACWNTLSLISAIAILAVAATKPSPKHASCHCGDHPHDPHE